MVEFYDPYLYDLNVGPGSRVGEIYLAESKKENGPILELGCGTGDILLPISREGIDVTGIDISPAMLGKFKERLSFEVESNAGKVRLVHDNMESFSLSDKFQQIFIANDGIAHLLDEMSLRRTLRNSYEHLTSGGRLILDISAFDIQYLARFTGGDSEILRNRGCFPFSDNNFIQVWEQTQYDPEAGILTATFRYELLDSFYNVTKTYYRHLRLHPRRVIEVLLALEVVGFTEIQKENLDNERWIFKTRKK